MSILYLTENLLAGNDVTITSSSEDALYVLENLYCGRPSKPFRFAGIGSPGNPEWIACQFAAAKAVNFVGIFNHNLTALATAGDSLRLKGSPLAAGAADWSSPAWNLDLSDRLITGWNDLYRKISENYKTYRLEVIDQVQESAFVELGELVLGVATKISSAYIQPERRESPQLARVKNVTPYGQHWMESLAHSVTLNLQVWNGNDIATIDSLRTMILAIHNAGGKFVLVPNDGQKWAYYVALENDGGFMDSVARGDVSEVSSWTLELRTLTRGISLL